MKFITAALVAMFALLTCTSSYADQQFVRPYVSVGAERGEAGPDGYWIQQGFDPKVKIAAPTFFVGVAGDLAQYGNIGLAYRAGYAWLGTVHTDSLAVADADYNTTAHECVRNCDNPARFVGSGHESGFVLALQPYYQSGDWRFSVEGGPFIHRSTWAVDATGEIVGGAVHIFDTDGWRVGAVVGASVSYKRFTLSFDHYIVKPLSLSTAPPIWHAIDEVSLGYKF